MNEFTYHRPTTLDEAASIVGDSDDGKFLSGGQSFLPILKLGMASPDDVVDLKGIAELRGIHRDGDRLVIGAAMRHAEVERSDEVKGAIPSLSHLAGLIGDAQVRNRGTLGGSLAHGEPRADYPGAVQALDGIVHTNQREIPAEDFFVGLFMTDLEEDEIITAVSFRIPDQAAYTKFPHPASKYPVVGAYVARFGDEVRVAITGAFDHATRVPELEQALGGRFAADAIDGVSISPDGLQSDADFSAAYRAHLIGVMTKRAVNAAS